MTPEKFKKLPKWAQDQIKILANENDNLKKLLKEFNGDSGQTNTAIRNGLNSSPLPNNAHIEFLTGPKLLNRVSVYVRNDGDIDVNTDSRCGETMVVMPRAANSFYIKFIS